MTETKDWNKDVIEEFRAKGFVEALPILSEAHSS